MKISTSSHNTFNYVPREFKTVSQLAKILISGKNYSCGLFKGGHRNNQNFIKTYTIGLDIDNGENEVQMSLDEAKAAFKDYKHIIMPTKSHQKDKHGIVADRFRVILFMSKPIENHNDYVATWSMLKEKYPAIDRQCKDPARFWYPSNSVVSQNDEGKLIEPVKYVEKKEVIKNDKLPEKKGKLARNTLEFMLNGAPNGLWNATLTKAAIDVREQGYNMDECITLLSRATGHLDDADKRCIGSIYSREMKYGARDDGNSFNFREIDSILSNNEKLEWCAERLLIKGGLSIFAGRPKSGKSTLVRQLVKNIINNEEFLGRKTQPSKVLYLALEEHDVMLKEQFNQVGIKKGDPILIHTGMFKNPAKKYENLTNAILETGSEFVVIDTMALFCGIEDLNNYNSVNVALTQMREICRDTKAHIMMIHHLSKGSRDRPETILGSTAISGAVDNIISLTRKGNDRYITSQGRGCRGFYKQALDFNWEKQTYSLGEGDNDEF